jgi:hypothetical protein
LTPHEKLEFYTEKLRVRYTSYSDVSLQKALERAVEKDQARVAEIIQDIQNTRVSIWEEAATSDETSMSKRSKSKLIQVKYKPGIHDDLAIS